MPRTKKDPRSRGQAKKAKNDGVGAFRERLLKQRDELLDMYKHDLRAGQESRGDDTDDIVDRANNAYNREMLFSLSNGERILLMEIEEALQRLEGGSFGDCDNCGEEIGDRRLEALPWARYCINCQELEEKGLLHD